MPSPPGWTIALEKNRATGIALDSIEGFTGTDSARLVSDFLTAAAKITDGTDPVFRGIPFFVRKGYRLNQPAFSVLIGEVVRRINEEANPREEHLLLIAERNSGNPDYEVAFHARSAGKEESLETSEVLAAIRLVASNRYAVILTFEYEDGGKIGLLERFAEKNWRLVWKSAYTGC
jgi:hypothetical protein